MRSTSTTVATATVSTSSSAELRSGVIEGVSTAAAAVRAVQEVAAGVQQRWQCSSACYSATDSCAGPLLTGVSSVQYSAE
eukprot:4708-Heterococcus_DN1.PRE.1